MLLMRRRNEMQLGHCLQDMITTGSQSMGCVTSQETYEQRMQRSVEIEAWSNDLYTPALSGYRPNVGKGGLRKGERRKKFLSSTARQLDSGSSTNYKRSMSWGGGGESGPPAWGTFAENPCPFPLDSIVPQPPPWRLRMGISDFPVQFFVGMELAGPLVLPAAICFKITLYLIIIASIPSSHTTPTPPSRPARVSAGPPARAYHCDELQDRRWTVLERERRWTSGMQSRDSDEYHNRKEQQPLFINLRLGRVGLRLLHAQISEQLRCGPAPAPRQQRSPCSPPLAVSGHITASAGSSNPMSSISSVGQARSSEDGFDAGASANRLIPSPQTAVDQWNDAYEAPGAAAAAPPRARRGRATARAWAHRLGYGSTTPSMLRGAGMGGPGARCRMMTLSLGRSRRRRGGA
ncbi:hypothetical protein C8R43DRAFT_1126448 [Mycena crocata]|nr:hypothetical protein C8R43DRAFT_1126448 [Mycena crocata]